jgi:DNA-binding transcriptional regulator YiaG
MDINLKALADGQCFTLSVPDLETIVTPQFVTDLREKLDLSQSGMAVMMHVSQKVIADWENGKTPITGGSLVALYLLSEDNSLKDKLYHTETTNYDETKGN